MLRALAAAMGKDFRLLARDRVGLVFLTLAPIIVITVAGFSLASLYGAGPRGDTEQRCTRKDEQQCPAVHGRKSCRWERRRRLRLRLRLMRGHTHSAGHADRSHAGQEQQDTHE